MTGRNKDEIQKDLNILKAKTEYLSSAKSFVDVEKLLNTYSSLVHDYA